VKFNPVAYGLSNFYNYDDDEEEEETSQSPFGKAQGKNVGGLPAKPCDRS